MPLFSIPGKRPENLGVKDGRLARCPSSPNCVSSDAERESHRVEAYRIDGPAAKAWQEVREAVAALAS